MPATQAFAQVVTGAVGAPIGFGGAAGAAGAAARPGAGAWNAGPAPLLVPGGAALVAPITAIPGVAPSAAASGARGLASGVAGSQVASPVAGLALPVSLAAPGVVPAGTLEHGAAQRAPPSAALRLLEAPRAGQAGSASSESAGLALRSREDARFDGAGSRAETPSIAPAVLAGRSLAVPALAGAMGAAGAAWTRSLSALRDAGRPAAPEEGRLLPSAPGVPAEAPAVADPPAPLDPSTYRVPAALRWPARIYMVAHGLGLAGAAVAVGAALGWAALASAALVGGALAWQVHRLGPLTSDPRLGRLGPDEQRALESRVGSILDGLLGRIGILPSERPRVVLTNERGPENAIAVGNGIDPKAVIKVGEGLHFLPTPHVEGFLAHELGHLAHRDLTPGRYLRTRAAMDIGKGIFLRIAAWGTAFQAVPALWSWLQDGFSLGAVAAAMGVSLAWLAIGYAAAMAGFLFGLAALREQELRADHWAGWLAGPEGWASYLEGSLARLARAARGGLAGRSPAVPALAGAIGAAGLASLRERLLSEHPSYAERIRRLRGR